MIYWYFLLEREEGQKVPSTFTICDFSPQTFIRSFIVECMHFLAFFREDWVKVELSRAFKGHLIIKVVLRILPLSRRKLIVCTSFVSDGLNVCKNGISSFTKIEYSQQSYKNVIDKACFCLLVWFGSTKITFPEENQNSTTKHKIWFLTASNLISTIKENAATNFIFVLFVAFEVERDECRTQENIYLDFANISHRSYCCIDTAKI